MLRNALLSRSMEQLKSSEPPAADSQPEEAPQYDVYHKDEPEVSE